MIPISVFLFLAVTAGALALYSFLERQSWMYSQITAAALSSALLWVLALMLAAGNVWTGSPQMPLLDPTLPYIFALFAVVMTIYFGLHITNWLMDRIMNQKEEEEEE